MKKSGNGNKISDENWSSVKSKYSENKKIQIYWFWQCIMFKTTFLGKTRIYLWILGIFAFSPDLLDSMLAVDVYVILAYPNYIMSL